MTTLRFSRISFRLRRSITLGIILGFACLGCSSDSPDAPQNQTVNPLKNTSPSGRESMERRNRDVLRMQEMNAVKTENKISPFRYVTSTEQYSIFGQLVKASTHSRAIHGNGVTLLCPTDKAFAEFDNWKMMLRRGQQSELDDFIAHHVLLDIMTYEDFKLMDEHATLSGDKIAVQTAGGIYANDAHVRSGYVATENGNIIGLDDILYIPFSLR